MYDYHMHSLFSSDAHSSIDAMIKRAISLGIKGVAITDHYDPDFMNPAYDYELDFNMYQHALMNAEKKYSAQIRIAKGMELGLQQGSTLNKCSKAVSGFLYDFILGSFHCAEGYDISMQIYFARRSLEETYRAFYSYVLETLKLYKNYDVLAHFNIIDRYSPRIPPFQAYADIVKAIMELIVVDGKGIEINTSSKRYGMGGLCTPTQELLNLYANCGGEIITIGSDAHRTVDIGYAYLEAKAMILETGLKHVAVFKDRQPELIRI